MSSDTAEFLNKSQCTVYRRFIKKVRSYRKVVHTVDEANHFALTLGK